MGLLSLMLKGPLPWSWSWQKLVVAIEAWNVLSGVHLKVGDSIIHYSLYRWRIGSAGKSGDFPRDIQR